MMKRYLVGKIVTAAKIDEAEKIVNAHMGQGEMAHFNRAGWEHILHKHGGHLPIVIKALPEGMTAPAKNVLMTVVNTDPECYWLTNYLETLLVQVWYPMTVCTQSREQKKILAAYFEKTGCEVSSPFSLGFQLNDFGVRGVSSMETAAIGGAAHLVNFLGSDNMPASVLAMRYYGAKGPVGFSIPAAEHSTITSWTKAGEVEAYRNMLTQYPTGSVAVVSDSYDIFNAVSKLWGGELKSMVEQRAGRLIIRPDSGEPKVIVVQCLKRLGEAFGTATNGAGYKVLPPYVRLIQGDGVSYESLSVILAEMTKHGWVRARGGGEAGVWRARESSRGQALALRCACSRASAHHRGPRSASGLARSRARPRAAHLAPAPSSAAYPPRPPPPRRRAGRGERGLRLRRRAAAAHGPRHAEVRVQVLRGRDRRRRCARF
jgi:nicotinamide phosphoribosyltransferase